MPDGELGRDRLSEFMAHAMAEDWPEYLEARFSQLSTIDDGLARRLTERLVDRMLPGAALSMVHRAEAIGQTRIEVGLSPDGTACVLSVTLPLGSGQPGYQWNGTVEDAEVCVDNAADRGIEDVLWDRDNVGPTGWEPEFDDS
jgi:hypothetical protein